MDILAQPEEPTMISLVSADRRLPSADCRLLSAVASFLISEDTDPLLSMKSVASFFKKL